MDWIDEKIIAIKEKIKNMSLKRAMAVYLLFFIVFTFIFSAVTMEICQRWIWIVQDKYVSSEFRWEMRRFPVVSYSVDSEELSDKDRFLLLVLQGTYTWCPYFYGVISMIIVSAYFYKYRLNKPFQILEQGAREIGRNNLDFQIKYDSEDEMGRLCKSFDTMRRELIRNEEKMWRMLDEKQRLNAAFAHDLRTPLTVVKGYVDVLARFIPEGKISREKLLDTLETVSEQIDRLENYSNTMKNIHCLEDMPVNREALDILSVQKKAFAAAEALQQIEMLEVTVVHQIKEAQKVYLDENIVLEVVENLLSNAVRYAKGKVELSMELSGRMLYVYVSDDGCGFSEEALEHGLKPYYREGDNEGHHFGIGLHICNLLCQKHGGCISLSNSMKGGANVSASFEVSKENSIKSYDFLSEI